MLHFSNLIFTTFGRNEFPKKYFSLILAPLVLRVGILHCPIRPSNIDYRYIVR